MVKVTHKSYALLFHWQETTKTKNFTAKISSYIRAHAVEEHEGWWIYGVEPGGLAESGKTLKKAVLNFKQTLKKVLLDIASITKDFSEFQLEVGRFLSEVNEPENTDWKKSVLERSVIERT